MSELSTQPRLTNARLPFAAMAASLVAMVTLYIVGGSYVGMPIMIGLLLATYAIPWRLPKHLLLTWPLRLVAFSAVILTTPERRPVGMWMVLDQGYAHLFGYLCCAELVLRMWQRRPGGPHVGEALVLSALMLAVAGNTYHRWAIVLAAPLYVGCILLLFDRFRSRRSRSMLGRFARGAVVGLVLMTGLVGSAKIREHGQAIMNWSMSLLMGSGRSEIGLTDSPVLTSVFNPEPSQVRVLRVRGYAQEGHLRAMSFDTLQNGRWQPPMGRRAYREVTSDWPGSAAPSPRAVVERFEDELGVLCMPLHAGGVIAGGQGRVEVSTDSARILRTMGDIPVPYRYEFVHPPGPFAQGPLCAPLGGADRAIHLQVPTEVEPGVREIARELANRSGDSRVRVAAVQAYLSNNYTYSLRLDRGEGEAVSEFLLRSKKGHCQYFASAAVVLLRCMGIPARFVNGYYAHERDGDDLIVRQRDAHAWAEAYVDGVGWITVDATPSGGRPDELFEPVSKWRRTWESFGDLGTTVRAVLGKLTVRHALGAAVLIMVVAGAIELIKRLRVRGRTQWVEDVDYRAPEVAIAELGKAIERLLVRNGLRLNRTSTWREQIRTSALAEPRKGQLVALAQDYAALRFGVPTVDDVVRVRNKVIELEP